MGRVGKGNRGKISTMVSSVKTGDHTVYAGGVVTSSCYL